MRITVDVKTSSRIDSVEKVEEDHYVVRVRAPPRKGKANRATLKLLRRYFGRDVSMLSGHTSTRKIIEVEG